MSATSTEKRVEVGVSLPNGLQEFSDLLEKGIVAARLGEVDQARHYLVQASRLNPDDPRPWLWLSATIKNPDQQRQCFQKVLELDPDNQAAMLGLSRLRAERQTTKMMDQPGSGEEVGIEEVDLKSIQPKGIYPFRVEEEEARSTILSWLGKSSLGVENTKHIFHYFRLKRIFFPMWNISGQAYVNWTCRILASDDENNINFHFRNGDDIVHFENILVPGSEEIEGKVIEKLEPFDHHHLKPNTQFDIRGATILSCERDPAMASTLARIQVGRSGNKEIQQRILPGKVKHNFIAQVGDWIWEEHNLVLIPIWKCDYTYEGRIYHVYVNGQTGKIRGEKPYVSTDLKFLLYVLVFIVLVIVFGVGFCLFFDLF